MTEETPENPPIRPKVYALLEASEGALDHDDLVRDVGNETGAGELAIAATVRRMERAGAVYNVTGDENDPSWKLTHP